MKKKMLHIWYHYKKKVFFLKVFLNENKIVIIFSYLLVIEKEKMLI